MDGKKETLILKLVLHTFVFWQQIVDAKLNVVVILCDQMFAEFLLFTSAR